MPKSGEHEDQIAPMDPHVGNRGGRQVHLQALPARAVVERHEHAELGAGVEESLAGGVLSHDPHRVVQARHAQRAVELGQARVQLAAQPQRTAEGADREQDDEKGENPEGAPD